MPAPSVARRILAAAAMAVGLLLPGITARAFDADALWNIVHGECVPNQLAHGDPKPCAEVDLKNGAERGYAVLKDIRGATQYLLIPTQRIVGIESPALLASDAENYFADAWNARSFVEKAVGHALPIDTLSLAVNSVHARTQNQLHIHIDCIRPDVRATLIKLRPSIGTSWAPLPEAVGGYGYWAMRVMGASLAEANPFKLLAEHVPGARADMKLRTLVVAGMRFEGDAPGFVILQDRADLLHFDFAAGARLQDHDCALAQAKVRPADAGGAR
jgi:CDP-diacylglycerol pyrophosphatase